MFSELPNKFDIDLDSARNLRQQAEGKLVRLFSQQKHDLEAIDADTAPWKLSVADNSLNYQQVPQYWETWKLFTDVAVSTGWASITAVWGIHEKHKQQYPQKHAPHFSSARLLSYVCSGANKISQLQHIETRLAAGGANDLLDQQQVERYSYTYTLREAMRQGFADITEQRLAEFNDACQQTDLRDPQVAMQLLKNVLCTNSTYSHSSSMLLPELAVSREVDYLARSRYGEIYSVMQQTLQLTERPAAVLGRVANSLSVGSSLANPSDLQQAQQIADYLVEIPETRATAQLLHWELVGTIGNS